MNNVSRRFNKSGDKNKIPLKSWNIQHNGKIRLGKSVKDPMLDTLTLKVKQDKGQVNFEHWTRVIYHRICVLMLQNQ